MKHTCRDCKFFCNDPAWLEREFPGMNALSSAYSTIRGEAGVCMMHDIYLAPVISCRYFTHISKGS